MSVIKKFIPETGVCVVEFTLPELAANHAKKAAVVGDFNSWSPDKNLMKKDKSRHFKCTIELTLGKVYEFRYLVDDVHWINDWDADAYAPTPYKGEYNMVLSCVLPEQTQNGK
jgi:1,4-alpha-glucan branching enzyme